MQAKPILQPWIRILMEIAKLILEYIKALAWPGVTITIILIFKAQISRIIGRLSKANLPGGVTFDFNQEIKEAETLSKQVAQEKDKLSIPEHKKQLPSIPLTEANARMISLGLQPSPSGLDMSYYRNIAKDDPTVALAGLRMEIEILARNLAKGFKVDIDQKISLSQLLRKLRDSNAITQNQSDLALKILRVCNAAIHGQFVTFDEANSVIDTANVLRDQYLRWLSWGFDDEWQPRERR